MTSNREIPHLLVTINTKRDHSGRWNAPPHTSYTSVQEMLPARLTELFEKLGIRPTYFLSPEVVFNNQCAEAMRMLPHCELATLFRGEYLAPEFNLKRQVEVAPPLESENAKIEVLTEAFLQQFGYRPLSFRTSEFCVGSAKAKILRDLGYLYDSSIAQHREGTEEWGDAFPQHPDMPCPIAIDRRPLRSGNVHDCLWEVPVTMVKADCETLWFRSGIYPDDRPSRIVRNVAESNLRRTGASRPLVMILDTQDLVPGVSLYCKDERDLDLYFRQLEDCLRLALDSGFEPSTLCEYGAKKLANRESDMTAVPHQIPSSTSDPAMDRATPHSRPRILVVADVPGWIFDRHAHKLQSGLADEFEIDISYQGQELDESQYDLVYPMEWNLVPPDRIRTKSKWVTGIRSHISWQGLPTEAFKEALSRYSRVHVVSRRLNSLLSSHHPRLDLLTHGIDLEHFRSSHRELRKSGSLRIGWAGNRRSPAKGFEQFIEPLGGIPGVELKFCGYSDRMLDFQEMRSFYEGIDVYVCSSSTEGSNNSLLEAAAMGCAIVTTDVGTVPEYLEDGVSALIVPRTPEAFRNAILRLLENPELTTMLGANAAKAVSAFDWNIKLGEHARFFQLALSESVPASPSGQVEGKLEKAEDLLRRAMDSIAAGDFEAALGPMSEATLLTPDQEGIRRSLADLHSFLERRRRSESSEMEMLDAADRQMATGDLDGCLEILQSAEASNPGSRRIVDALAWSLVQKGNLQAAHVQYIKATQLWPNDPKTHANLAGLRIQLGQYERAEPELRRILELAPHDPDALLALSRICCERGDVHSSEALNAELVRFHPEHPRSRNHPDKSEDAPSDWNPSFSFCLITNGNRPKKLRRELDSIRALGIDRCQILISGMLPPGWIQDGFEFVPCEDAARKGRLGEMRNRALDRATGEVIVVADDDLIFHSDFADGIRQTGPDFDILSSRILNMDGSRFWDWAVVGGSEGQHLIDYDKFDDNVYVTGGLCVARPQVFRKVRWDEHRGFYQLEDVDFTMRARAVGVRIRMNTRSTVTHGDARYWGNGQIVLRTDFVLKAAAELVGKGAFSEAIPLLDVLLERSGSNLLLQETLRDIYATTGQAERWLRAEQAILTTRSRLDAIEWDGELFTEGVFAAVVRKMILAAEEIDPPIVQSFHTDSFHSVPSDTENRETWIRISNRELAARHGIVLIPRGSDPEALLESAILRHPTWIRIAAFFEDPSDARLTTHGNPIQWISCSLGHVVDGLVTLDNRTLAELNTDSRAMVEVAERLRDALFHTSKPTVANHSPNPAPDLLPKNPAQSVRWVGPVFNFSGYARLAREALEGLMDAGTYVSCDPQLNDKAFFASLSKQPSKSSRWRELLSCSPEPGTLVLCDMPRDANGVDILGAHQRNNPGCTKRVCWTMFESDRLPRGWAEALNTMDEVWVPSQFNRATFARAGVRESKIHVIPGCIDAAPYVQARPMDLPGTGYTFLSVFQWIQRKGYDVLLEAWAKAFKPTDPVRLVLRSHPFGNASPVSRQLEQFLSNRGLRRHDLAPVHLIEEFLPDDALPGLFAASDCFVLPSRGEGWGLPYLEAMAAGKPVIGTRWSAQTDFLTPDNSWLLSPRDPVGVGDAAWREVPFLDEPHRWADPSVDELAGILRHAFEHPEEGREKGRRGRLDATTNWTPARTAAAIAERLAVSDASEQPPQRTPSKSAIHAKPTPENVSINLARVAEGIKQHRISNGIVAPSRPEATNRKLSVRWEGSQFVHHSLAHVNRELCLRLAKNGHVLSLIPFEPDQFAPGDDQDLSLLARLHNAPLEDGCQIHVRHQWPPNLEAPAQGNWVVIQPWEFGSPPKQWISAFADRLDDLWVPSSYCRDLYVAGGMPADRVHVVPNGVDCNRFRPGLAPYALATKKTFKFLYVGGTIARKGFDTLLNAWKEAFGPADDVCLVVKDMGGGSFYKGQTAKAWIQEMQESRKCAEIEYLDGDLEPNRIPSLYAACDVLVHPYRGEGFGLPIAEAMACGLPCIVTRGGAADDFCGEAESWGVPARRVPVPGGKVGPFETVSPPWWLEPSIPDLVDKLRVAKSDHEARRSKGDAARRRIVEGFTWDKAAAIAEERLLEIASRPPRRTASGPRFVSALDKLSLRITNPGGKLAAQQPAALPGTETATGEIDLAELNRLLVRAEAAAARGELGEAEHLTEDAVARFPHQNLAWLARAMVLRGLGKFRKASEAIDRAIKERETPEALLESLQIHLLAGDAAPARKIEKALKERHSAWFKETRELFRTRGQTWPPDLLKPARAANKPAPAARKGKR